MPKGTPTYLTIDQFGNVGAVFPGGVQISEVSQGAAISAAQALTFFSAGAIQEYIQGENTVGGGHVLNIQSGLPSNNSASLFVATKLTGAAGTSQVGAAAEDPVTGIDQVVEIIDSLGRSSFLQGGYAGTPPPFHVYSPVTIPARTINTVYIPNANRPTWVEAVLVLQPSSAIIMADTWIGNRQEFASGSGATDAITVTLSFFVPAGFGYELSQALGVVSVTQVVEIEL